MASVYRRLRDADALVANDVQKLSETMDVGSSSRLEIQVRVIKAGTAGNVFLQHAAVNEEGAFIALTGASWALNATSNTHTTIVNFLRFIRWAGDANVATAPVPMIDIIAKDK